MPWGTLRAWQQRTLARRRVVTAWRRLLHEEEGVALVLAIITMLVLTIALTTVMFMTAAGARDAHRSNAGQKASALAESGINNALAVLNANYPGTTIYPGDSTLLPTRTTTYPTGSVTWSGTLVNVPTNPAGWKWQWQLTAQGSVKNPTGPTAADVVRTATAIVPVVIPDSTSVPPGTTATDWVYGLNDVTFSQSVNVAAPVYAGHDIILANTATIAETIPESLTLPARPNRIAAGAQPVAREPAEPGRPRQRLGRSRRTTWPRSTSRTSARRRTTRPLTPASGGTPTRSGASPTTTSSRPATSRLRRSPAAAPIAWAAPADGASHPASPSYMGFWYLNAGLGPKTPCATSSGTPPRFDTVSGIADNTINQSAYLAGSPFDLTGDASYSCTSADGQTKLAWDKATDAHDQGNRLHRREREEHVRKREVRRQGDDHPQRALLDGQQHALCVNSRLRRWRHPPAPWDADTTALAIVADGIDPSTGDSIDIKKGHYQGLLLGNGNIDGSVSGTDHGRPDRQRLRERQRRTERHAPVPSDHLRGVGHGRTHRPASTPSTPRTHPIRRRIAT